MGDFTPNFAKEAVVPLTTMKSANGSVRVRIPARGTPEWQKAHDAAMRFATQHESWWGYIEPLSPIVLKRRYITPDHNTYKRRLMVDGVYLKPLWLK